MRGKVLNDLTSYINEQGVYLIKIGFSYKSSKGNLYTGVINYGEYFLFFWETKTYYMKLFFSCYNKTEKQIIIGKWEANNGISKSWW